MVDRLSRVVHVYPDPLSAGGAAAERLVALSDSAVERRGRFALAVSGGRSPEPLFRALAARTDGARRWPDWQLFFCDERVVPQDDPRSNLGLARRLWLGPARFPEANVHPVETSFSADEGARRYEATLRAFFPRAEPATFDAATLGIGPDGHTASLFPGSACLDARDRWAVAEPSPALPPEVARVTLTLEGIRRARTAIFLVAGADKRPALTQILSTSSPGTPAARLPAARVTALERVEWFVDEGAAPVGARVDEGTLRRGPGPT